MEPLTAVQSLHLMLEHLKELNYTRYCIEWAKLSKRFPLIMATLSSWNSTSSSVPL